MIDYFWFILFFIVLSFDAYHEQYYIFIYYTIWTFTLETLYFGLKLLPESPSKKKILRHLFDVIFAPTIVVAIGFWLVIAPIYLSNPKPKNAVFVFVTHGFNAFATIYEIKTISVSSIWKPILYTTVYNLFLIVYVCSGHRSISGKLPYWYAQYDTYIGWIFVVIAIAAVAIVHVISSVYIWPERKRQFKQYIV